MAYAVDIRSSRVNPEFLHGNSTSHTWAFSAIAELIDNAYDPDANAAEVRIDTRVINRTECLTFVDNGNGMTQDTLHKMLSFGYCDKKQIEGEIKPIGYYGNGFKSGSMRLGKDAIVFTKNKESMSVGLLSQTFLKNIKADTVLVPIVTWELPSRKRKNDQTTTSNLYAILQHSIFKTEEELLDELSDFGNGHGTNIIIYNLRMTNNNLELDFTSDPFDIRNPETSIIDLTSIERPTIACQHEYRRSLREYCSILYLKPRMKIVIRGRQVKTKLMSKSLSETEKDRYKPTWLEHRIHYTFGFTSSKNPEDYGIMMYHNNRLIKAFEKVGYQKQANDLGVGVIGVVEANFLEPIHNKQDFNRTDKYSAFITNVSKKLNDYWNEKKHGDSAQNRTSKQKKLPDWTWAQCDNCLNWRRLPAGIIADDLPEKWYCHMNPDESFNRCDIPEEPENEDEALQQPVYKKTFKKKLKENKQAEEYEKNRKKQEEQEQKQLKETLRCNSMQLSAEAAMLFDDTSSSTFCFGTKENKQAEEYEKNRKKQKELERKQLKGAFKRRLMQLSAEAAMLFDDTSSSTVCFGRKENKQAEEYEKNRKKQEEQEWKQLKGTFRRNLMQLSAKKSSSEDSGHDQRQLSQDDLDRITMRPPMNKNGIMEKQSIRINLQKPKKITQEQSNERLQMAEQLKFSNKNPNAAMLFDDTSSSTVCFSSRCDIPEEPENEDEALQQPVYKKTFKKKLKENKQAEEYEKNRKKQEEEQELKQLKETLRCNLMQLSAEKSSSEDSGHDQRQPSQDDLDRITMRPPVNKDGIMEKQSIRINLQKPKKITQEQNSERLQMAEQLKFSNKNPNAAMFFDDTSSSTVSFGSSFKRKLNDNGRPSKIFIEDDVTVTFVQKNAEDDNVLDLSNLQEMDEDEEQSINHNISQQDVKPSLEELTHNISQQDVKPCMEELEHNISQQDVKPSIEELNRAIILLQPNVERLEKAIKKSKPVVEFVHQTVQTVPVVIRLATQDDVDLGKLSPLEKSQHLVAQRKKVCELQKKLEDTNSRFKSLQVNICKLLKLIDPDFDCGQPDNIENIILDFIRVRVDAESE